jgi:hypothetical protein
LGQRNEAARVLLGNLTKGSMYILCRPREAWIGQVRLQVAQISLNINGHEKYFTEISMKKYSKYESVFNDTVLKKS